ncbi:F0F1 ATP synthase subunit A [soil metagenome]
MPARSALMDTSLFPTNLIAAEAAHEGPGFLGLFVYVGIAIAVMFALMAYAKLGFGQRVFKNPITSCFEQLYLFTENMCMGTIGPHGRRYIPMMMTFWMLIFTSNLMSLFFASAPTADFSFNLGLALISIAYVQYEGARMSGVGNHVKHFTGPKLGLALIPITGMIFVIELVSELMKNVSLSLRLFGNIDGGHRAVEAMNGLGWKLFHVGGMEFGIPFGAFLIPVKLLTCVVQAMIFTLLTCVYISLVTHHEEEHNTVDGSDTDPHGHLATTHA